MKSHKSQLFLFDLIFSFVILIVSVGLILAYFSSTNDNKDLFNLNLEIMNGFTNTKINSLNDDEIKQMFIDNYIRNVENSVAQQVCDFHFESHPDLAWNLSEIFVDTYLGKQININISIENETGHISQVYYKLNNPQVSYVDSLLSSSTQRTVYGIINKTNTYGPYIFRIKLWS